MILPITAKTNSGLCGHCRRIAAREEFDAIVASWERDPTKIPGTNGIPEPTDIALAAKAHELREAPSEASRIEKVCHDYFDAAHTKWHERGVEALSSKERHVLAVETFYGEVTNGGLVQYLGNDSYAFANWAAEGFEKIGIREFAELMRRVQALFPDSIIPEDQDLGFSIVEKLDEGVVLSEIEEVFWNRWRQDETEIRRKLYAYIAEE
jgi:hypothetical protein